MLAQHNEHARRRLQAWERHGKACKWVNNELGAKSMQSSYLYSDKQSKIQNIYTSATEKRCMSRMLNANSSSWPGHEGEL